MDTYKHTENCASYVVVMISYLHLLLKHLDKYMLTVHYKCLFVTGSAKRGLIAFLTFCLMSHNSSWLFAIVIKISPAIEAFLEGKVTKFQTGTMLTSQVMDSQIQAIEKAIRPLFADPVTFIVIYNNNNN